MIDTMYAYTMTAVDHPLEKHTMPVSPLEHGEALVEIAGCGVCHTDLSFWHYGVPTRQTLPLVLGHEISGIVLDGPVELKGKPVIVPAVLPCGECDLCEQDRGNICQHQKMPGNDFNGGFASHIVVPSRYLIPVPSEVLQTHSLAELSVIADAISTPYQSIVKSKLKADDFAIVIGVGGVGIYAAQIAQTLGATVVAVDISQKRLDLLSEVGIRNIVNSNGLTIKETKQKIKEINQQTDSPNVGWKIFEISGTKAGQELAFALLGVAGTLSIVGFTMEKLEVRLSNLMAFDAQVIGTWGCKPELYNDVLHMVGRGDIQLKPFTEIQPMSAINHIFQNVLEHKMSKRTVLVPDFKSNE